jgi:hypothetical protein
MAKFMPKPKSTCPARCIHPWSTGFGSNSRANHLALLVISFLSITGKLYRRLFLMIKISKPIHAIPVLRMLINSPHTNCSLIKFVSIILNINYL